ncbi:hypothetical protein O7A70_12655 [Mesorhizobium sp. Cs1299R1N1]|uniref:hypothetical protein n=1 Tax=Mesorhizobium sp. Cs1299R1N1 TaxID=3015172 RepID=UPI00301D11A9
MRGALGEAIVAALPVALVYFSGWAYLTSYLGEFGIDATQIDVSFTTVLVYAFVPLKAWYILLMLLVIVALVLAALLFELHSDDQHKGRKTTASALESLAAVAVVILLFAIKSAAGGAAKEMAHDVWKGFKSQSVAMLGDAKVNADAVALYDACRHERRLRQIIGLPNQLFLLCRSNVDPCNRGTLFVVNNEGRIIYIADKIREDIDDEGTICTT